MTKKEFESRVNKSVSQIEFDYANEVYMNSGDMDKDAFCAEFQKVSSSNIVAELSRTVSNKDEYIEQLKADAEKREAQMMSLIDKLIAMTDREETISKLAVADEIIDFVGAKHYLQRKAEMNCTYLDSDYKELVQLLKEE